MNFNFNSEETRIFSMRRFKTEQSALQTKTTNSLACSDCRVGICQCCQGSVLFPEKWLYPWVVSSISDWEFFCCNFSWKFELVVWYLIDWSYCKKYLVHGFGFFMYIRYNYVCTYSDVHYIIHIMYLWFLHSLSYKYKISKVGR